MKRAIVVAVSLALLLPVLAVCASAGTLYTFYPYEPVAIYAETSDFVPTPDVQGLFVYDGILPPGKYKVTVMGNRDGIPVEIVVADSLIDVSSDGYIGPVFVEVYFDGVLVESGPLDIEITFVDGFTALFAALNNEPVDTSFYTVAYFESVDDVVSLVDYVTSDTMDVLLDDVFALIPVVLSVIVGYIAVRKGIRWVQGVLRNS